MLISRLKVFFQGDGKISDGTAVNQIISKW